MLTREEAIDLLEAVKSDDCSHPSCVSRVLTYLKRQPGQPRRKVIHTSCCYNKNEAEDFIKDALCVIATCNDGSVFSIAHGISLWEKLPPIPQDDEVTDVE